MEVGRKSEEGEEGSGGIRFRSHEGTDERSECFLICVDVWERLSPWGYDHGNPSSSYSSSPSHSLSSSKEGLPELDKRGARIMVLPRVSVGYSLGEYERGRKDHSSFRIGVEEEQGVSEDSLRLEEEEKVEWKIWPPKLVANYPYGEAFFADELAAASIIECSRYLLLS